MPDIVISLSDEDAACVEATLNGTMTVEEWIRLQVAAPLAGCRAAARVRPLAAVGIAGLESLTPAEVEALRAPRQAALDTEAAARAAAEAEVAAAPDVVS